MEYEKVIDEILRGDVDRFSQIVHQFDERIRDIVSRQVKDHTAREELVQETFYQALKNLDQLNDPARLEAWLAMIARRNVTDHFRKKKRHPTRQVDDSIDQQQPTADHDWIWDEVARLNAAFSEVLNLRYRVGLSYEEIATRLEIPRSTVRGRIYEARLALRKRLGEGDYLS